MFDCDACPLRQAVEALDVDNLTAWSTMNTLSTRFLVDTHATGLLLDRLTRHLDAEEFGDLMTRLSIIYDVRCPPSKPEATG